MRTEFTDAQRADPAVATSESIIRACVHCGFCTATCPTYVLLGDELDSPRGRIYLIKQMLEQEAEPTPAVVKHVDRCLSCLSCMTTCPSGVNYMHLVDHARSYIEQRYRRPLGERLLRSLLALVLPYRGRFRLALHGARLARFAAPLLGGRLRAMLSLAPRTLPAAAPVPVSTPGTGVRGRVILMQGCVEPVLRPEVRAATVRLLERIGYAVVFAEGEGCCGALVHHMGRDEAAREAARRNIDLWTRDRVDAVLITASGCGTTVKDYGFLLRNDPDYAARAEQVSALALDISEFLERAGLPPVVAGGLKVAYHGACSLQHGQKVKQAPQALLRAAGFEVHVPAEAHLCCGSAGTYNILQPEIAGQLGDRKAAALDRLEADVIATGNIGCAVQIGARAARPVVHLVELLDWATGGPRPAALRSAEQSGD